MSAGAGAPWRKVALNQLCNFPTSAGSSPGGSAGGIRPALACFKFCLLPMVLRWCEGYWAGHWKELTLKVFCTWTFQKKDPSLVGIAAFYEASHVCLELCQKRASEKFLPWGSCQWYICITEMWRLGAIIAGTYGLQLSKNVFTVVSLINLKNFT